MLTNGERQVAPELSGIRRDHVARYEWAARLLGESRRVIDLACGVGYGAAVLADAGHTVLGLDRSAEAIEYAHKHYNTRANVTYSVADANEIVSIDGDYLTTICRFDPVDAVTCFETIEHLADPLLMLRAIRDLAPLLIASVPNETVFPHGGRIKFHHRHYTKGQFRALLWRAGFEVAAWYGQADEQAEVAPDIEGRTLIAVARRRVAEVLPFPVDARPVEVVPAAAARPVPGHVAIVGLGPSGMQFFELIRGLGGASAYCDEVWGINAIGDTFRCDRIFHMDDVRVQEARAKAKPQSNIAAMVNWLKRHPGPIYTSVVREGYPGLVAFPLEEVLNRKHESNGGAPYFNSTAAYAIAYAIHIGVKRISLFGLDFTYPNRHHAEKGRGCCEFWLGIAAARGIEITLPDRTSLLDACEPEPSRLYGYDCVDVYLHTQGDGSVKVEMIPLETVPSAEAVERAYDHSQHPNPLMKGA